MASSFIFLFIFLVLSLNAAPSNSISIDGDLECDEVSNTWATPILIRERAGSVAVVWQQPPFTAENLLGITTYTVCHLLSLCVFVLIFVDKVSLRNSTGGDVVQRTTTVEHTVLSVDANIDIVVGVSTVRAGDKACVRTIAA